MSDLLLTLVSIVACSDDDPIPFDVPPPVQASDSDDSDVPDSDDTDAGDLARIDNGDGTYSYALPDGFDPTLLVVEGPLTWSYVEQAKYSDAPTQGGAETYVARADQPRSLTEQLMGTVRVDYEGRIWHLTEVDTATVAARVSRVNGEAVEDWDVEELPDLEDTGSNDAEFDGEQIEEKPGDVVTWEPQSWTTADCDGLGTLFHASGDNHFYDGDDDRKRVWAPFTDRQKPIVDVVLAGLGRCTGVILSEFWVVTSAHCMYDGNDNPVDESLVSVVRRDGAADEVHTIRHWHESSDFTPQGTDPTDDYTLLHLTWPLSEPFEDMNLSSADDGVLRSVDNPQNLALPGWAPWCDDNWNVNTGRANLYHNMAGALGSITSQKVNLLMDSGPGHSGSPVYWCPDGHDDVCEPGDKAWIIGITSGWNGIITSHVAAKSARFRDWGVALMDDN